MFAGPNGSGKSTLKLLVPGHGLGHYINPDELLVELQKSLSFDFQTYQLAPSSASVTAFFSESTLIKDANLVDEIQKLVLTGSILTVSARSASPYFASVLADFLRKLLLSEQRSFLFETVMSSRDKVELLRTAQQRGYRTYLYFIATEDPSINISRVRQRVARGGHDVPVEKIITRYHHALGLRADAISCTNRAYLFDNSQDDRERIWLAEITDGESFDWKLDVLPAWLRKSTLGFRGVQS
jgi:predicted ABC-type ATPase